MVQILGSKRKQKNHKMEQLKEYYAFISYKREDKKEAKRLQHALEFYRLPNHLRQENPGLPEYVRPVFRDMTDLEVGELSAQIHTGLEQSHFLIVVCSPRAATSKWVNDEVEFFISLGKQDKIIPYIIEGVPHASNPSEECYPPALLNLSKEKELLGANINEVGKDSATIRVVSRMFNIRFDTLYLRYQREQKKHRRQLIAIIILAFLFLSGIAGWIWHQNVLLKEREWKMMENQARSISEKAMELIAEGDVLRGIALVMSILPDNFDNPNIPFVYEMERALRAANDSLLYGHGPICMMKQHYGCIYDAAYSHNNIIATASNDNTIRLWNMETGEEHTQWRSEDFSYYKNFISLSPNGKYLIKRFNEEDPSLSVWELGMDSLVFVKKLTHGQSPTFSDDGKYLYIEQYDLGNIQEYEIKYNTHNWDSVSTIIKEGYYSPDRTLLIKEKSDGFDLFDAITKKMLEHYVTSDISVSDIIQHSDRGPVFISKNNKYVIHYNDIVDLESKRVSTFEGEFLTFCNGGEVVMTTETKYSDDYNSSESWLYFINPINGQEYIDKRLTVPGVIRVAFECPDGKIFVGLESGISCIYRNPFTTVQSPRWDFITKLPNHSYSRFSRHYKYAITHQDDSISLFELKNRELNLIDKMSFHQRVLALSFNPAFIVAQHSEILQEDTFGHFNHKITTEKIELWDKKNNSNKEIINKTCPEPSFGVVDEIAISHDGKYVAYGDYNTICLWDAKCDSVVRLMKGHQNRIKNIAFSSDGNYIASTSYDYTSRIWRLSDGKEIVDKRLYYPSLDHGSMRIDMTVISPNNRFYAVLVGKVIYLYDFYTNFVIFNMDIPKYTYSIDFSEDGTKIYAEGKSGLYEYEICPLKKICEHYLYLRQYKFSDEEKRMYYMSGLE